MKHLYFIIFACVCGVNVWIKNGGNEMKNEDMLQLSAKRV
jgi:hypothetical protein